VKKFIPYEKLSKKKKREIDNLGRNQWNIDPNTKCEDLGYKRHKMKKIKPEEYDD
jgi:hypothetical protein